jgi:hypothetical protein
MPSDGICYCTNGGIQRQDKKCLCFSGEIIEPSETCQLCKLTLGSFDCETGPSVNSLTTTWIAFTDACLKLTDCNTGETEASMSLSTNSSSGVTLVNPQVIVTYIKKYPFSRYWHVRTRNTVTFLWNPSVTVGPGGLGISSSQSAENSSIFSLYYTF